MPSKNITDITIPGDAEYPGLQEMPIPPHILMKNKTPVLFFQAVSEEERKERAEKKELLEAKIEIFKAEVEIFKLSAVFSSLEPEKLKITDDYSIRKPKELWEFTNEELLEEIGSRFNDE